MSTGIIITIIVAIPIIYVLSTYNTLIKRKNKIKQAESGIEVYLNQRFDLIPNLVECVKGYMQYEKSTLEKITELRSSYLHNKNLKDGEILNNECNKIMAVAEKYPELKANENFINLQKNLTKMESQLQAARRIYNAEVNLYNNKVKMVPSNFIAGIFGFKEEQFFEIDEAAKNNINVDL